MDSQFAIVELLGHQRFGAKVEEEEFCGAKLLRCEVLTEPSYVRKVNPTALYALTPCTEERARLACRFLASPLLMPAEPVRASLPAPSDNPYEGSPADDDIPFGEQDPEDETDECDPDPEEFECDQCKATLSLPLSEEICLPDDWEAIPFGWSVVTNMHPDEVLTFCSPACVREFLWKPPARQEQTPEPTEPRESIEVSEALAMRHVQVLGDWYGLEHKGGLRLTDAHVEGTRSEMLLLARAIQSRQSYSGRRCAVRTDGDRVYLWSPLGSEQKASVPLAIADALASEILSFCANNATKEESRG